MTDDADLIAEAHDKTSTSWTDWANLARRLVEAHGRAVKQATEWMNTANALAETVEELTSRAERAEAVGVRAFRPPEDTGPFDEEALGRAIKRVWGPAGAHADLYGWILATARRALNAGKRAERTETALAERDRDQARLQRDAAYIDRKRAEQALAEATKALEEIARWAPLLSFAANTARVTLERINKEEP